MWVIKNTAADYAKIAETMNISEVTARVIINRGIKTYKDAGNFLNPDINSLPDPFSITGMDAAVKTVMRHIKSNNKIAIYGDYDVDGVMSAVILIKAIDYKNYVYYVPDRETEGYGLNLEAIEKLHDNGVKLIIACDNGITAINEAQLTYDRGMELIIIDHHQPLYDDNQEDILPKAEAIINPKMRGCTYPFKQMCAAALCYRFAYAFSAKCKKALINANDLLSFAAIATVCDIVDLLGDNRIIAKNGLSAVMDAQNYGIKALINIYELSQIGAYHAGFILGPVINASGRLGSAKMAAELFLAENQAKADEIAHRLVELNNARKNITEAAFKELDASIDSNQKVFVLYNENIHESVAGIVAGRIKDKYNHPAIVITKGSGYAKGSARSITGYNIFDALSQVSHLFIKFGGHPGAAGISLPYENIDKLRNYLNQNCPLTDNDFVKKLNIDFRLPINEITFKLAKELSVLEPFGKANKEPVFAEKNVRFSKIEFIGKDKTTLRLKLYDNPAVSAIAFNLLDKFLDLAKQKLGYNDMSRLSLVTSFYMDIAFNININEYRGQQNLQLVLRDIR